MNLNDIKKLLYKKNPPAGLQFIRKGVAYYISNIDDVEIKFEIPVSDMGDADFLVWMDSKYLIRWISFSN